MADPTPDRIPVVGITIDAEPNEHGSYDIYSPNGLVIGRWNVEWLARDGIPVPRPPRVGTLGLSEADTRRIAIEWKTSVDRHVLNHGADLSVRFDDAAILLCRSDVARWDAEDQTEAS